MADQYGPDGHGPPPSPEVAKVRDQFFGDQPIELDPEAVKQTREAVKGRIPSWRARRRQG